MAAAAEAEGAAAAASPLGAVAAPPARRPAPPKGGGPAGLAATPGFEGLAEALSEVKLARERLHAVVSTGRRLAYVACARLQRSDFAGARAALDKVEALPSLSEAMGEELWNCTERRLVLCGDCSYSSFLAVVLAAQGFLRFLEEGRLAPHIPERWQTRIPDVDDDAYLTGVIDALREIERYAVNRGQALDLRSVRVCLGAAQCLEEALMQFNFRNSNLRQRFDAVKYHVKRLESLVYEIDLAQQRIRCTSIAAGGQGSDPGPPDEGEEEPSASAAAGHTAIDLDRIGEMLTRYELFDEKRELFQKRSRDVVKMSKNAIYALQREDFDRADAELARCAKEASAIYEQMPIGSPTLRLGFFSGALEEMAEALSFRAFRRDRVLLSIEDMQVASGLPFRLLDVEYLGGLMDLTGEVGRQAIRSAGRGRSSRAGVETCLACVDAVYNGLQELPYLPGRLTKKMGTLRSTMSKIEGALYELALLSEGFSAPRGGGVEEDALGESDGD